MVYLGWANVYVIINTCSFLSTVSFYLNIINQSPLVSLNESNETWNVSFQTNDDITVPPPFSLHFLKQSPVQTQACNYRLNQCAARGKIELWFGGLPALQNMCSEFKPQIWNSQRNGQCAWMRSRFNPLKPCYLARLKYLTTHCGKVNFHPNSI